jgi:hypothetical protein
MTRSAEGRSLELYFIDGNPDGMLTAEVFNWTGHVLKAPRTQIAAMLSRKEARHTGVYLLLGDKDGEPLAYVGEGESISDRIKSHDAKKDWWKDVVIVTTGANNLHKAHVKYLESRLVEIANTIKRVDLENGNTPPRPGLSEAAQANMESFLEYLLMVLPALRIDMFLERAKPEHTSSRSEGPVFELINRTHDLRATAVLVDGDFIVEEGSQARLGWVSQAKQEHSYMHLRAEVERSGILSQQGDRSIFTKSYAFESPSAAAAVVLGRNANGTTEWMLVGTGQTYKEWEAAQLAQADDASASV